MKNVKIPVHLSVVNKITTYIAQNFGDLSSNDRSRLLKVLLELWTMILTSHTRTTTSDDLEHIKDKSLVYTNLHRDKLVNFKIRVNNTNLSYSRLLDILYDCYLVDVNENHYAVGRFSKSYRPKPGIDYSVTTEVELDLTKIFSEYKTKKQLLKENSRKYRRLITSLYECKINLLTFNEHLTELVSKFNVDGEPYKYDKYNQPKYFTPEIAHMYILSAIKINLGLHYFSISSSGRHYTSMASLPKIAIDYLTVSNKKVIEIDAANSQPLLLGALVDNQEYKKDCEDGVFYDMLAKENGKSRDHVKNQSYKYIFFNNDLVKGNAYRLLELVYPGLADQINEFKFEDVESKDEKDLLWWKLQNMESKIWVNSALEIINPIITRHDSVLILSEDAEEFRKIVIAKYKALGLKVTLK